LVEMTNKTNRRPVAVHRHHPSRALRPRTA
jgi:hypothetical protein